MPLIRRFDPSGRPAKRRGPRSPAPAAGSPLERAEAANAARVRPKMCLRAVVVGGDRSDKALRAQGEFGSRIPTELAEALDRPDSIWRAEIRPVVKGAARQVDRIKDSIKSGGVDLVYVNTRFASHRVSGPIKLICASRGVPYGEFSLERAGDTQEAVAPVAVPPAPKPRLEPPPYVAPPPEVPTVAEEPPAAMEPPTDAIQLPPAKPRAPAFKLITSGGAFDPDNPSDLRRLDSPLDHLGGPRVWENWGQYLLAIEHYMQNRMPGAGDTLVGLAAAQAERLRARMPLREQTSVTVAREMLRLMIQMGQRGHKDFKPFAKFDPMNPEGVNLPGFYPVPYFAAKLAARGLQPAPQDSRGFRQKTRELRKEWEERRNEDPYPFGMGLGYQGVAHVNAWTKEGKRQTVVLPETVVEYAWDRAATMEFGKYEPAGARDSRFFLFAKPKVVGYADSHAPMILAGFLITRNEAHGGLVRVHAVTTFTMAEMLSGATEYMRYKRMSPEGRIVCQTLPMVLFLGQFPAGGAIEGLVDMHTGGGRILPGIDGFVRRDKKSARDLMARFAKLAVSCLVVTNALDNQASFITGEGDDIRPPRVRPPKGDPPAGGAHYKTLYLSEGAQQALRRKWYMLHRQGRGGKGAPPGYVPPHLSTYWVKRGHDHLEVFPDDEIETRRHPDPDKAHLYWVCFERAGWGDKSKETGEARPTRTIIRKLRPGTRLGKGIKIAHKPKDT